MLSPWTKSTTSIVSPFHNRRRGGGFNPSALFALSEPGVWYDPSDVANLAWRRNLLTFTEQFDNAVWVAVGTNATATKGTISTGRPDGSSGSVNTLTFSSVPSTAGSYAFSYQVLGATYLNTAVSYSVWLRVASGTGTVYLNVEDSVAGPTGSNFFSSPALTLTTSWQRFTVTGTRASGTGNAVVSVGFDTRAAAGQTNASSLTVQVWGAQLELGSVATDYQRISNVNTEVIERFPSATLYQDSAGTTPVTTPGDPVGLMLDKSKGLILGSELVVNGTFNSGTADWTTTATLPATLSSSVVSGSARLVYNHSGSTAGQFSQGISVVAGRTYRITATATVVSGTANMNISIRSTNSSATSSNLGFQAISASGSTNVSFLYTAASTTTVFLSAYFFTSSSTVDVDNISVRELPGFHATSSGTSRPTYGIVPLGGRRNLLTRTEEFNDVVWSKANATVTVDATTAPNGAATADALFETTATGFHSATATSTIVAATAGQSYTFSFYLKANGRTKGFMSVVQGGDFTAFDLTAKTNVFGGNGTNITVTAQTITELPNGWFRLTSTVSISGNVNIRPVIGINNDSNVSSYAGDATKGFYLWGSQLEAGSTATNYQRVGAPSAVSGLSFDVTEAGVPSLSYLYFDGTDDFMVTPTITPGIDKVQVFAGVRKLSDAGNGTLLETSAAADSNNGAFYVRAPTSALPNYQFVSRGSTTVAATATTFTAPITNVVTGIGDISGDNNTVRVNGAQAAQNLSDQGTGNYLAYPLYIGRRAGTTLQFNGQLFSLIARFGTNLDATSITNTEFWIGGKTPEFAVPTFVGVPTIGVA